MDGSSTLEGGGGAWVSGFRVTERLRQKGLGM